MKKRFIFMGLVLALYSCGSSPEDEMSRGTQKITCQLNNMRVDDDSEYHITYTYPNGNVESQNDRKTSDMDTFIVRRSNVSKPVVIIHIDYVKRRNGTTDYYGDPTSTEIIVPQNYNIHEMNDGI